MSRLVALFLSEVDFPALLSCVYHQLTISTKVSRKNANLVEMFRVTRKALLPIEIRLMRGHWVVQNQT